MLGLNLVLLIVAIVAALIAAGLLWWRSNMGKEIALMAATPTSSAAEAAKLPAGTLAEVKGTVRCDKPLTSEFSNQSCVYFHAQITREEVYYERDSDGKQQRRTRTHTIHSNIKHAPFHVEDASGRLAIDPEGASFEATQTINRTENPDTLTSLVGLATGTNNTYRRQEWTIAHDIPVYLLGEIKAGGVMGSPAKGSQNRKFVISVQSEEERAKSLTSTSFWVLVGAIVLFVAAAGLLYAAWRVGV